MIVDVMKEYNRKVQFIVNRAKSGLTGYSHYRPRTGESFRYAASLGTLGSTHGVLMYFSKTVRRDITKEFCMKMGVLSNPKNRDETHLLSSLLKGLYKKEMTIRRNGARSPIMLTFKQMMWINKIVRIIKDKE